MPWREAGYVQRGRGLYPAVLLPTCSLAVSGSLTGDKSCMVSADTGFCSVHLCPQSKSKVPHVYAANSSTCSQNTPVPEEGFLGGNSQEEQKPSCSYDHFSQQIYLLEKKPQNQQSSTCSFNWQSFWYLENLGEVGLIFFLKYLRYVMAQSTMICKQRCPRDYLQTGVTSPCPQAELLLTLNSDSANTVQCQISAVLEWDLLLMAPL